MPVKTHLRIEVLPNFQVKVVHVHNNGTEYFTVYTSMLGMVLNEVVTFVMNEQHEMEEVEDAASQSGN